MHENKHQSQTTGETPVHIEIRTDHELTHPQVINLLREHLAGMHAESPPDKVHALDLSALRQPHITFLTAWRCTASAGEPQGEQLMACGAIKELDATHGEIKSMRTAAAHLRQGAAKAILSELLAIAQQRGYSGVSLETGNAPAFEPAMAMYREFGFVDCGVFGDYRADPFSRFMTLDVFKLQATTQDSRLRVDYNQISLV